MVNKPEIIKAEQNPNSKPLETQEVALLAAQFMSSGNLTEQQTDKVLDEQTRVNQYRREDNKEAHLRAEGNRKTNERMVIYVLVFAITLFIIIALVKPDYISQALTGVLGFLGGLGVGNIRIGNKE